MGVIDVVPDYFTQSGAIIDGSVTPELIISGRGVTHVAFGVSVTVNPNVAFNMHVQAKYSRSNTAWYYGVSHNDGGSVVNHLMKFTTTSLATTVPNYITPTPDPESGAGSAYPLQWQLYPVWGLHSMRFEFANVGGLGTLNGATVLNLDAVLLRLPWGG
ncbi:MAG: hypothetical protein GY937_20165 [bacterium]|nr:hypothetical protein [bacterium]